MYYVVEEAKPSAIDENEKRTPVKKVTRVVKRKVVRKKTPVSAKSSSQETSNTQKEELLKEEEREGEDSINEEPDKNIEVSPANVEEPVENKVIPMNVERSEEKKIPAELVGQSSRKEEIEEMTHEGSVENKESVLGDAEEHKLTEPAVEESLKDDKVLNYQDVADTEEVEVGAEPNSSVEDVGICHVQKDEVATEVDLVMKDVNTIKSHEPVTRNEYEEAKKVVEKTKIVEGSTKDAAEPVDMEVITTKVLKEDESSEQVNTENGDAMLKSNQVMEKAEVVVDRTNTTEPVGIDKITTEGLKEDESSEQADMEHGDEKIVAQDSMTKTNAVDYGMDTTEEGNIPKITTVELEEDENPEIDHMDEKIEERGGKEVPEEFNEGVLVQDNVTDRGENSQRSEEEHVQLTALAEERRRKKELEIFVGGLDRDAVDEDVRKVFEHVGEVVEVQVHKDPSSSKNKGYAFVKFATKEQAKQALADIKHPVVSLFFVLLIYNKCGILLVHVIHQISNL